eukprot:scaffold38080_cov18-Prasinocladus_malaysianus.AAC.1
MLDSVANALARAGMSEKVGVIHNYSSSHSAEMFRQLFNFSRGWYRGLWLSVSVGGLGNVPSQ